MWEALLAIRHYGCPVSDTSADIPEVHVQNLSKAETGGHRSKRLIYLRGDDAEIDRFAAAFREHESVRSFRRISAADAGQAYFSSEIEYDDENPSVLGLITSNGCYRDDTVSVQRGIEHWGVYAERKESLHELIENVETLGNDLDLHRSVDLGTIANARSMDATTMLTRLTSRQQEAFETAHSLGYYDGDSDVVMEDLGEAMGVHPSTAWEHLKKAEDTIMNETGKRFFGRDEPTERLKQ